MNLKSLWVWVVLVVGSGSVWAQSDDLDEFAAWNGPKSRRGVEPDEVPSPQPQPGFNGAVGETAAWQPLEMEMGLRHPRGARLLAAASTGNWAELVELLNEAGGAPSLGGVFVAPVGPGLGWVSARHDARERLFGLPGRGRALAGRARALTQEDLLRTEGERREPALWQLVREHAVYPAGVEGARELGERLLERGDVEGALFVWRRLQRRVPDAGVESRVVMARSLLGVRREGSLGASVGEERPAWRVLWARDAAGGYGLSDRPALAKEHTVRGRAVVADGRHVYYTDERGVVAAERTNGRTAWRFHRRGYPVYQRLALGHGRVVLADRLRLVGLSAATGERLWERSLENRFGGSRLVDVAATPSGFVGLLSEDGQWAVRGWDVEGRVRFETRLWEERQEPARVTRWVRATRQRARTGRTEEFREVLGPSRRVWGDGRLAVLGDAVFLTVDGLVGCFAEGGGELVWLRDRSWGVEVRGAQVYVDLRVGPYAVEAVTAAGQLVRLDPLDGRGLRLPGLPGSKPVLGKEIHREAFRIEDDGSTPDEERPYVLGLEPLVLMYRGSANEVTVGPQADVFLPNLIGPLGPGVVLGDELAIPDPEGVVLFDLGTRTETVVRWPAGVGSLQAVGGLLVVCTREGFAVLGRESGVGEDRLGRVPLEDVAESVRRLDSTDWEVRRRAERELAEAGEEALPYLGLAGTAHGVDVGRELLLGIRREEALRRLARGAPEELWGRLRGGGLIQGLVSLQQYVSVRSEGSVYLLSLLQEEVDPQVRFMLYKLLLRVDDVVRRRALTVLTDRTARGRMRAAVAAALVESARTSAERSALNRMLWDLVRETEDEDTLEHLLGAASLVGHDALVRLLQDEHPELLGASLPRWDPDWAYVVSGAMNQLIR